MKKVFLKLLTLRNFKGIRDLSIEFDEKTNIFGRNRAGKSTIADAFSWLLWSKDQMGREDYEIKTLDENNQPIHQLSHEVEALFLINGREERVKKIYKEVWSRKKGEKDATFTGHEKLYFWNDVPMKMADFNSKVNSVIDEGMFKLITNPLYFNSLHWEKRRTVLLDIAGKITDNEIFDKIATAKNDYGTLIMVLNSGKTTIEYKKEIGAKKIRIKKEMEGIPSRIDEADRSKPESFDFVAIINQITSKEEELKKVEELLSDAATAQSATQKTLLDRQNKLHDLKSKLSEVRFKMQSDIQAEQNAGTNNIYQVDQEIKGILHNITLKEQALSSHLKLRENNITSIADYNSKLNQLRTEWSQIDAEQFVFEDAASVCPTCKQMLQQHDVEVKKQELLGNFNISKSNRLNEKVKHAGQIKESIAGVQRNIELIDGQIGELKKDIESLTGQQIKLKTKLDTLRLVEASKASFDIEAAISDRLLKDADAVNLQGQIKTIEAEFLNPGNNPAVTDTTAARQQKYSLQQELNALRDRYSNKATIERINNRIEELKRQEETLSQELAGFEKQEFDILNYDKARMDILESRINNRFKLVTFKMFNRNINGGEEAACECLFKGVPFGSLNTEAKINCGLDIINVLCDHYGVSAPVFIDNRESVSEIIPTSSQVINLIVDPAYSKLYVQQVAA